jgi:hypothetical protein
MTTSEAIVVRNATAADAIALERLAALDSREPLAGPAIIAERNGIAYAALDLSDGSVAADPFVPTVELVKLLRRRAADQAPRRARLPRVGIARRRRTVHA